jgi:dTDP-glucose 4,6-dehydratase
VAGPILVTGGAGFIGSALVRRLVRAGRRVVNLDALTYAANPAALEDVAASPLYAFEHADLRDDAAVQRIFRHHQPAAVIHLAAETHVDRSIYGPGRFVDSNVVGTLQLLQAARDHWLDMDASQRDAFRFIHVSTDEVFGTLSADDPPFTETSRYDPRSPYSASKAASDHLVRAWFATYGLPVVVTHSSNNFGPWQNEEKLIPRMILCALHQEPLPVYGDGSNRRDWIFVDDQVEALIATLTHATPGDTLLFGSGVDRSNLDVVRAVCDALDQLAPRASGRHSDAIVFVADRPGHDWRYAVDASRARAKIGWIPSRSFAEALQQTVVWYTDRHR